jgi:hypothetical protein
MDTLSMRNQTAFAPANPSAAFLGFCHRASQVREGNTDVLSWNILGLGQVILSHILPLTLDGWFIGLAFQGTIENISVRFRISDDLGGTVGTYQLSFTRKAPDDGSSVLQEFGPLLGMPRHGWTTAFLPLKDVGWVFYKPGAYYLELFADETWSRIGTFMIVVVDPLPLTPERITALKSEPNTARFVRIELGCKFSASKCRVYTALEKNELQKGEGWTWYEEIPSEFRCECEKTVIDLQYIRRNLFGLLGRPILPINTVDFVPMYHAASLRSIFNGFAKLISNNPAEEILQQFINENPVLLHQFPSNRILVKPKILTYTLRTLGS